MEALFADLPSALANTVQIARRCNLTLVLGKPQLPDFPRPTACRSTTTSAPASHQGLERRLAALFPDAAQRDAERAALRAAAGIRDRDHHPDGLSGLLPHRLGLHRLGQGARLPGGARPRFGRRFAGGLCALHHRPRPAALQAAVRALPEPGAGVDARLRHRLLPGQPRPRHRLREGQVRPRRGEPDRHLRHHGQQGRAARRGPRARHGLRPCGQRGQAGARAAGQDLHAGAGARGPRSGPHLRAQGSARTRTARGRRGRSGRAAGAGHARRRPGAQRRHARRRRAHRAGQDHRLLPAVPAARQRQRGEPVRQGRRRSHRPGQVRLPGPGHADHPGAGQGDDPRPAPRPRRLQLRVAAAGRRARLQAVQRRPHRERVPVRKPRHAGHAARRPAEPAGGPDRAERDVPPGADGEHPELLRAQERPRGDPLPAPAAGAGAGRDLRHLRLPGTGDGGRARAGRLFARRCRHAAPRDGQEEGRGDGQGARQASATGRWPRASRRTRPTRSST